MKFIKLVAIGLLLNLATLTEAEAEAEAAGEAEADPQLQYIQSQGFFKLPPSYQQRDFGLPPNSNEPFSTFALKFVGNNLFDRPFWSHWLQWPHPITINS